MLSLVFSGNYSAGAAANSIQVSWYDHTSRNHISRNSKSEGVLLPCTMFSIFFHLVGDKLAYDMIIWGLICYLPPYGLVSCFRNLEFTTYSMLNDPVITCRVLETLQNQILLCLRIWIS